MTADQPAVKWPWRDVVLTLLAAEALAAAVWLLPASIHIVKWPSSGPVRLALLPPAWQLGALCVGAFVLALVMLAVGGRGGQPPPFRRTFGEPRRSSPDTSASEGGGWQRRHFAPLLLLWLWTVPYWPWLPDRLPLLLVLAGPIRWAIAASVVVSVLFSTTTLRERLPRLLSLGRGAIFVASLSLYLALGLYSARVMGVVGDEPHYLIITESLLKDGDLKIENNHQQRDYLSFYQGELRPDFFERGKNGEIYSIHAPGLPVLILPAYAVAGRFGAIALMALVAALTALAVFDLADAIVPGSTAVVTWAACCLTVPFIPHAWLIFPEMPGALIVAWAALWFWQSDERSPLTWLWRGLALGALPWLHTKFVVFLAIFAAALALRLLKRPRALVAFAVPLVVSGALWLYSFYAIYGAFDPEAPYGDYTRIYVLTRNIPHGLLGIFFDQKFGLLFYSPIYLAAVAGAWLILRRADTRFLGAVLLLVVAAFVGTTARLYMFWGGSSAPARFLVPILPCLAPLVALAVASARSAVSRALVSLTLAISLALAVIGVARPDRFMLYSDPHGGGARVLEAIQAASPLSAVMPAFTNPDWVSHVGQLLLWLLAAAAALVAMVLASQWERRASAWRLAGVGCLTFLLVGAVATARPTAEAKNATATRGDLAVLWRFDGNRFRTLDYETFGRATPERFRQLTTLNIEPERSQIADAGYTAGPLMLPPGRFETRVWFANTSAREGDVLISTPPKVIFGRSTGSLANPTTVPFDLLVAIRRLSISIPNSEVARAISKIEVAPVAVVPAGERENIAVRTLEPLDERAGAYLIYSDEHVYPEGRVFWSRGTAATTVWIAPNGASKMILTLATGPMTGQVALSVAGATTTVAMTGGEVKALSFDLSQAQRLVPVTVQSSVMFRPAELDGRSTDRRGLGCQVRVNLE